MFHIISNDQFRHPNTYLIHIRWIWLLTELSHPLWRTFILNPTLHNETKQSKTERTTTNRDDANNRNKIIKSNANFFPSISPLPLFLALSFFHSFILSFFHSFWQVQTWNPGKCTRNLDSSRAKIIKEEKREKEQRKRNNRGTDR